MSIISLELWNSCGGCMESLNPEFALFGSNNECNRNNTVLPPIPEVSTGVVSFIQVDIWSTFTYVTIKSTWNLFYSYEYHMNFHSVCAITITCIPLGILLFLLILLFLFNVYLIHMRELVLIYNRKNNNILTVSPVFQFFLFFFFSFSSSYLFKAWSWARSVFLSKYMSPVAKDTNTSLRPNTI